MAGWLHKRIKKYRSTPKDQLKYHIDMRVIDFTNRILQEYGELEPSEEGVVYWSGIQKKDEFFVTCAVAPRVDSSRYGFQTSHNSNGRFVEFICDNNLQYIAQIHSHPSEWVDHSQVDNYETAFRSEGLLSIVVPVYGNKGMIPFKKCGFHRFSKGRFERLSDKYIKCHFDILKTPDFPVVLKDFRYE